MQSDENFPQVSAYFKGVKWGILGVWGFSEVHLGEIFGMVINKNE